MKIGSTDKLLIGIVIGVIVLIAVAFVVVLMQPKPTYKSDDTVEGAMHNYLFALTQDDWARAYTYLGSRLRGRPITQEDFKNQIQNRGYNFGREDTSTWQVGGTRAVGNHTSVTVTRTVFYSNSLFGSSQSQQSHDFTWRQEQGAWKIVSADSYWFWMECWEQAKGCN